MRAISKQHYRFIGFLVILFLGLATVRIVDAGIHGENKDDERKKCQQTDFEEANTDDENIEDDCDFENDTVVNER